MPAVKASSLRSNVRTGPHFWKRAIVSTYYNNPLFMNGSIDRLLEMFDFSGIAYELPTKYMYSMKYLDDETRKEELINSDDPDLYAIHQWDGSWLETGEDITEFRWKILKKYPFSRGWSFDHYKSMEEYKAYQTSQEILKLHVPQKLVHGFKYNKKIIPMYNPSIINIHNLSLLTLNINSSKSMEIMKNTSYILIGRWLGNQCKSNNGRSYFDFDEFSFKETTGSGLILYDSEWNVVSYLH